MTATTIRFATIAALAAVFFAALSFQAGQASAAAETTSSAHESVAFDPVLAAVALVFAAIVMVVALWGMRRN